MPDPVGTVTPDMATVPFEKGTFTGGLAVTHVPNQRSFQERDEAGETVLDFAYQKWNVTGVGAGDWPKANKPEDYKFGLTQNAEKVLYEVTYTRMSGVSGSYPASWTQTVGFTNQRFDSDKTTDFPWYMMGASMNMKPTLVVTSGNNTESVGVPVNMWDHPSFTKKAFLKDASGRKVGILSKARLRGIYRTWVAITNTAKAIDAAGNLVPARYLIHNLDVTWLMGWSIPNSCFYLLTDHPDDRSKISKGKGSGGAKPITDQSAPTAQDGLAQPWTPAAP